RDFCLRQSDAVVLVARAGSPVPETGPVLVQQPDLVVVGELPLPAARAAGLAAADAGRLTVVDGDPRAGVADIADRLAGRSLGLVLAGGGAPALAHVCVRSRTE